MCKVEGDNTVPFTGLGCFWSYRWWLCMGSLDFTRGIEKDCERREQELNTGLWLNQLERSFPCQLWWQMGNTFAEPLDGLRQRPKWHEGVSLHPGPNCFCRTEVRTMWKNTRFYCSFYSSSLPIHSMSSFSERSSGVAQSQGRSTTQLVPLSTPQRLPAFGGIPGGWAVQKSPSPGAHESWPFVRCCLLRSLTDSLCSVI